MGVLWGAMPPLGGAEAPASTSLAPPMVRKVSNRAFHSIPSGNTLRPTQHPERGGLVGAEQAVHAGGAQDERVPGPQRGLCAVRRLPGDAQ